MPIWLTIVISLISCIGTGGILAFVQFLIKRHDKKSGLLKEIRDEQMQFREELKRIQAENRKEQHKSEKDALRTQLLLMMKGYPQEHQEILSLAKRYFRGCKGNWYCSSLFEKYLTDEGIPLPHWFDGSEKTDDEIGKE